MNTPKKVNICEVGLRDGLQNEKSLLTTDQKVELIQGLIDAAPTTVDYENIVLAPFPAVPAE